MPSPSFCARVWQARKAAEMAAAGGSDKVGAQKALAASLATSAVDRLLQRASKEGVKAERDNQPVDDWDD
jgi:hypothetical protein